ncbi:hypothetical protein ASG31_10240 [Chryseobacterium sp. Leaf404]|nr:hypothetical protein ASG31_10240 [Chryseobacterium sp. Leaf404]
MLSFAPKFAGVFACWSFAQSFIFLMVLLNSEDHHRIFFPFSIPILQNNFVVKGFYVFNSLKPHVKASKQLTSIPKKSSSLKKTTLCI